jgi:hypothetical protein
VIFNRSGYFRFFSDNRDFRIFIKGQGIEKHADNVYRIRLEKAYQDEGNSSIQYVRTGGVRFLY